MCVSIGPRPFSHGYLIIASMTAIQAQEVSIGPRLFSHGYTASTASTVNAPTVSIGPRPFSHGNMISLTSIMGLQRRFNWATTFQSWKYPIDKAAIVGNTEFQLGHDLSVMEIQGMCCRGHRGKDRFNWATTFQSWKYRNSSKADRHQQRRSFNWATTFQSWKWLPFFGLYCYRQSDDFHELCQQFKN